MSRYRKATDSPDAPPKKLTSGALFVLCSISLVDCINATILLPYVDEMVSDLLNKSPGDPAVAMWVALLVGSYSLCEVLFSGFWGMLADRVGRKPVLLMGMAGSAVAPVIFGASDSLSMALAARLLDGFFCGNLGVTRTVMGELTDETNEAKGFGTLSLTFSVGIFVGPFLGGTLSEPARWAPQTFEGTVFETRPFLLGNLVFSVLIMISLLLGFFFLEETLKRPHASDACEAKTPTAGARQTPLWTKDTVQLVVAFAFLQAYITVRINAFVLVTALPERMHGLHFSAQEFSYVQICCAASVLVVQACLYQPMTKRFGPHKVFILCLWFAIAMTLPFPVYCMVYNSPFLWRVVPVGAWQVFSQFGAFPPYPSISILVNRAAPPGQLATLNGWSNSLNSLCRGISPMLAGGLVSLGCWLEPSLPGGRYLVFYVSMLLALAAIRLVHLQLRRSSAGANAKCVADGDVEVVEAEAKCAADGDVQVVDI